ncbi:hypothetical protein [uncultured Erythrobacter sp.]|uniref:hypothetical protein n=1 Tax=uncultured Erythrobacter sp. TaxID=263913 RepID=UPI0026074DFD|nr:hypothetical protein [uncultured Erythrobacter sp.]
MPEIAIIFSSIIVMLIVIGIGVNALAAKILAHKRWERETSLLGSKGPAASEVSDRTDMLEDRVRVLERLATDRGATLADEIEALRDDRAGKGVRIAQQQSKELG